MEIERKFLVSEPPPLGDRPGVAIAQGYLATGSSEVRLRRRGETPLLTAKQGAGLTRGEWEVELDEAQFEALWPATEGARVQKRRYELAADGGLVIELDLYEGALAGLAVAEVEFPSVEAARAFTVPSWFGMEVTDDEAYKNRRLAVDGLPASARGG